MKIKSGIKIIVTMIISTSLLQSCGHKGPLTLPDKEQTQNGDTIKK